MEKLEEKSPIEKEDNREFIFRPWITKNGQKIYAKTYGKKAFKIYIN